MASRKVYLYVGNSDTPLRLSVDLTPVDVKLCRPNCTDLATLLGRSRPWWLVMMVTVDENHRAICFLLKLKLHSIANPASSVTTASYPAVTFQPPLIQR
jgi:hypothetical protein